MSSARPEMFIDREDAGARLARALPALPPDTLVLGIPRGGVVVARAIARALDLELDVVLARKVGAPGNPELAVGAVGPDGAIVLDERTMRGAHGLPERYIREEGARQLEEIKRREQLYRGERAPLRVAGRPCVVADDGIATGSTARAACLWVRRAGAAEVILAVPVAPAQSAESFMDVADRALFLATPERFYAVGQFYDGFGQVSDETVIGALAEARDRGA